MEYLLVSLLALAAASAQPTTSPNVQGCTWDNINTLEQTCKGDFRDCNWKKLSGPRNLFNVTCKASDLPKASIAPRNKALPAKLPIHTLDVEMTDTTLFGIEITPDFLNRQLDQLKVLILREDGGLDFGRGSTDATHGLERLEIHNSGNDRDLRLRQNLLKGFDQLTNVTFIGLSSSDIEEEAFTNMQSLQYLRFENCTLGEFEESAISGNPSLEMVQFLGNTIEEFAKRSIKDIEAEGTQRCKYEEERQLPVWEFIDNTIDKVDKEAIQINLAGELVFKDNHIERVKTNGLSVNIGSAACKSGKSVISGNNFTEIDYEAFSIQNKAGDNGVFDFNRNIVQESRLRFFPESFAFPMKNIMAEENLFPCSCVNSGHSWFMMNLNTTNKDLEYAYVRLWETGFCFEENNSRDAKSLKKSRVIEECKYPTNPSHIPTYVTPKTTMKPTAKPTPEALDSAASHRRSMYSLVAMILVVKYII